MIFNRRKAIQATALGLGALGLPATASAQAPSTTALGIAPDRSFVNAFVVRTDSSGNSVVERVKFKATSSDFFGVTNGHKEYLKLKATKFDLFSAPANVDLPVHTVGPATFGELFYTITGSSQLILLDGTVIENGPGTLIMFEDSDSKGRRGRTGPEGYVAMHVRYERAA